MAVPTKGKKSTRSPKRSKESTILTESTTASPTKKRTDDNLGHLLKSPVATGYQSTPVADPNVRFFFRHWPREWEVEDVDGEAHWLPRLSPHILKPGSDNIRTLAPSEAHLPHRAYESAVMDARRDGGVYMDPEAEIPSEFLPEGVPTGGYLRGLDCVSRSGSQGTRWVTAWTIPVRTLPGEKQQWSFDRNGFNRWRKHLVETGVVEPPEPSVMSKYIGRIRRHVQRNKAKPIPTDLREERVGRIAGRLEKAENAKIAVAK